jgi:hypothetical protein
MTYNYQRIKVDVERIIMHSRVLGSSCNLNAHINYKLMTVIKLKP